MLLDRTMRRVFRKKKKKNVSGGVISIGCITINVCRTNRYNTTYAVMGRIGTIELHCIILLALHYNVQLYNYDNNVKTFGDCRQ